MSRSAIRSEYPEQLPEITSFLGGTARMISSGALLGRRDGGLEATMDHEGGMMLCRETGDVYATQEPAAAFHGRTAFCLDIHNEVRPPSRRARAFAVNEAPGIIPVTSVDLPEGLLADIIGFCHF